MAQGAANISSFLALPIAALHGVGEPKLLREVVDAIDTQRLVWSALAKGCNDTTLGSDATITMVAALQGSGRRASTPI
jgi:hypothetical protein